MNQVVENYNTSLTDRVREAMANLKRLDSTYYWEMLRQRSEKEGGIGSVYPATKEELESEILKRSWYLYEHNEIAKGCIGAFTRMPGLLGIISLHDLPDDSVFTLVDPKKTGFCELLLEGNDYPKMQARHTTLILGQHDKLKEEVVFTFHPGDPITPSQLRASMSQADLRAGDGLTYEAAKKLGFEYAKMV